MVSEGILDKPLLYLSQYFEQNKGLYYDNLTRVRTHNDMQQWIKYFLIGVEKVATKAVDTLEKVILLKESIELEINTIFGRRRSAALVLLNSLFQNPVITVDRASGICELSYKAANDLVKLMQEKQYLHERQASFLVRKWSDVTNYKQIRHILYKLNYTL